MLTSKRAIKRNFIRTIPFLALTLILILMLGITTGCEGPAGPQGPQGPEGVVGPIGPAGEDGSQMYAGEGAPAQDVGTNGDYYLNSNTGEYYGPKDDDGWGDPIIVLMGDDGKDGEDGEDGQDGKDGEDGEDGSQIYSGSGAPDASKGKVGDYYLDKSSYELYGPKTDKGWGMPLNLKGADGNANVTRYLFPGADFSKFTGAVVNLKIRSEEEMKQSGWLVYLVQKNTNRSDVNEDYWSVPGVGANGVTYSVKHFFLTDVRLVAFRIDKENLTNNTAGKYGRIEIVRIEASDTIDNTGVNDSLIPDGLDASNYQEVAEYYNFDAQ